MRAPQVGDVKALDANRRRVQAERALQPLQRLRAPLAAALGAQALLVERQVRVALGQLEDATLLAALGRTQLDRAAAAVGERVRERVAAGQLALHDEQRGDRRLAAVVLQHELLPHLRRTALGLVRQIEGQPVREHAVAQLKHLRVRLAAVDRDRHGVERADRLVRHAPALE